MYVCMYVHEDHEPDLGARQFRWASLLALAGKVTNYFSLSIHRHFGLPKWNNSRHGECHVMPRFKI